MKAKAALLCIGLAVVSSYCYPQFGIDFSVGEMGFIGPNIRFSHFYELKPSLEFTVTDNKSNSIGILAENNFYLVDVYNLQNYVGFGIGFVSNKDSNGNKTKHTMLTGQYGLRYDFNSVVSVFGQLGLLVELDPVVLSTHKSAIGITLYFPNR